MTRMLAGASAAQLIAVAALPGLSRLFDPTEFGVLIAFLVIPNALLPAIGGKFEIAMVLPKSDGTARRLLGFALQICTAASLLFLTWILLAGSTSSARDFFEPLYLLLAGHVLILQYILNRRGDFTRLGLVKVVISGVTVGTMLIAGLAGGTASSLVFASLFGQAVALAVIVFWTSADLRGFVAITSRSARPVLRRNRGFPLLNAPGSLLDGLRLALPLLAFERWCSESDLGQFGMMLRITAAPIAVVALSISQVNLRIISQFAQDGRSAIRHVVTVAGLLGSVAIPAAVVTAIWGPKIFGFVLGEEWREAGELAAIYAPALAVRFIVSPLSSTLGATRHNALGMAWRVLAFVTTLAVLLIIGPTGDPSDIIAAVALTDVCVYTVYLAVILYAAAKPVRTRSKASDHATAPRG